MPVTIANQIAVRQLTPEDSPALEEMYDSHSSLADTLGFPPPDRILRKYWLEELRRGINLVAYFDGTLAGHLVLLPTGGAVQMAGYVHKSFRRQGLATALAKAAVEEAHLAGFHYIWLLIAKENLSARRCLEKLGFHIAWQDERELQFLRSTVGQEA
jgi:ribosomal protein S18 acetylase RimI-like enzyme